MPTNLIFDSLISSRKGLLILIFPLILYSPVLCKNNPLETHLNFLFPSKYFSSNGCSQSKQALDLLTFSDIHIKSILTMEFLLTSQKLCEILMKHEWKKYTYKCLLYVLQMGKYAWKVMKGLLEMLWITKFW